MTPWTPEERAWALDCLASGDSAEEIAEAAGRTTADVAAQFAHLRPLTEHHRQILSLYSAGVALALIGAELGVTHQAVHHQLKKIRKRGYPVALRECVVKRTPKPRPPIRRPPERVARDAQIIHLVFGQRLTATQAAREIGGVTRAAVCGVIFRHRHAQHGQQLERSA